MIYWKDFNYFDGCDVATVADNKKQKYKNAKEIFLGICDQNNNVSLFPFDV